MIHTDKQARKMICPYSFTSEGVVQCRASDCMAWRESDDEVAEIERTETLPDRTPPGEGWVQIDRGNSRGLRWQRIVTGTGGYCGRIGEP